MILKTLVLGFAASNCYIVGSEKSKQGIIIDPGDDADVILEEVNKLGLTITSIVVTHGHSDHFMALNDVKEATKAPFAIHAADAPTVAQNLKMMASVFGIKADPLPPPERLLQEDDIVTAGEFSFKVLHTPGHSPGGICLLGHGMVFTGDTLFNYGIGRTDFPGGNYNQILDSIKRKLLVLPDVTVVLPGHGPSSTIGTERKGNPFLYS